MPGCGGGRLLKRAGPHRPFWGCSNYPLCDGKARLCPTCGSGALVLSGSRFRCSRPPCGHVAPLCPGCGVGMLVPRKGECGAFLGCTEWRAPGAGPSCEYTLNVAGGGGTQTNYSWPAMTERGPGTRKPGDR